MKKLFFTVFMLATLMGFSQFKPVLTVADDTTKFGFIAPIKTLVFDYSANKLYKVDTLGNTSSTITSLGLQEISASVSPSDITIPVTNIFYVDGSRTDTYTADGSINKPYKKIQTCMQRINTLSTALAVAGNYPASKYVVKINPGTYADSIIINNQKYLRFEMPGVIISGKIDIATTQQTGDYYSKIEFWGGMSPYAEKGDCGELSGVITCTRNNDALIYLSFTGMEISNNLLFRTNGTWVVLADKTYFSGGAKYISGDFTGAGTPCVLLITQGNTKIDANITNYADSTTTVALYDCLDTEFDRINIDMAYGGMLRNCTFTDAVTIKSGTYKVDNVSYKEITTQTDTLAGATFTFMDSYNGGDVIIADDLTINGVTASTSDTLLNITGVNMVTYRLASAMSVLYADSSGVSGEDLWEVTDGLVKLKEENDSVVFKYFTLGDSLFLSNQYKFYDLDTSSSVMIGRYADSGIYAVAVNDLTLNGDRGYDVTAGYYDENTGKRTGLQATEDVVGLISMEEDSTYSNLLLRDTWLFASSPYFNLATENTGLILSDDSFGLGFGKISYHYVSLIDGDTTEQASSLGISSSPTNINYSSGYRKWFGLTDSGNIKSNMLLADKDQVSLINQQFDTIHQFGLTDTSLFYEVQTVKDYYGYGKTVLTADSKGEHLKVYVPFYAITDSSSFFITDAIIQGVADDVIFKSSDENSLFITEDYLGTGYVLSGFQTLQTSGDTVESATVMTIVADEINSQIYYKKEIDGILDFENKFYAADDGAEIVSNGNTINYLSVNQNGVEITINDETAIMVKADSSLINIHLPLIAKQSVILPIINDTVTDGAPTIAEIDAAIGMSATEAGNGYQFYIEDADGTKLTYHIISIAGVWRYSVYTNAL